MKTQLYFYLIVLIAFTSCSYLPEEIDFNSNVKIEETTEYISLSPKISFSNNNKAIIFLPGGLVDPHSYISLMSSVADHGTRVIIPKFSANLYQIQTKTPDINR